MRDRNIENETVMHRYSKFSLSLLFELLEKSEKNSKH